MGSPSLNPPSWRCAPCAAFAGVDYGDPPLPTTRCTDCQAVASPCALLRRELGELRDEIRSLRSAPVPGGIAATAEEQPMTTRQVAKYLGMTPAAVYMALRRCRLPYHRVGNSRSIRFIKREIDEALARR